MAIPQKKFREILFQILYAADFTEDSIEETTLLIMKELCVTKKTVKEAWVKAAKILAELPEIDALIRNTSTSYRFERIQSIERNVLRLGIYEILYDDTIPPKVAIAEALRLSKKFGTPESAMFVNALLDTIYKTSIGEKLDEKALSESLQLMKKSEEIAAEASSQPNINTEELDLSSIDDTP